MAIDDREGGELVRKDCDKIQSWTNGGRAKEDSKDNQGGEDVSRSNQDKLIDCVIEDEAALGGDNIAIGSDEEDHACREGEASEGANAKALLWETASRVAKSKDLLDLERPVDIKELEEKISRSIARTFSSVPT